MKDVPIPWHKLKRQWATLMYSQRVPKRHAGLDPASRNAEGIPMSDANSRHLRREGQVAAVCLLIIMLIAASPCLASIKVFEREYTYQAGEADSKLSSRTIALAEVKRLLLEELGTYLESVTEVKYFQLFLVVVN